MASPDDFGLSPAQTLAHRAHVEPSGWHRGFWLAWQEAIDTTRARLSEWRGEPDPGDSSATHEIESYRHVRLACRLVEPTSRPVGAVLIAGHGYGVSDPLERVAHRWRSIADRGVAVVLLRVRGFPGSQRDTGDLTGKTDAARAPHGWICHGLDVGLDAATRDPADAMGWVLPQAVADVVLTARAARARYGKALPLYLHGESFSAGLAVIAAARLARSDPVTRLVCALPTFGDWPWRLSRRYGPESASGEQVRRFMTLHARRAEALRETLLLCDTTVHARRVTATALCKLAERDDVVPAPTAAAVCNALATEPDAQWRFVTPFGHCDGGLADARRHALFWRVMEDFYDPTLELAGAMRAWAPLMRAGERTPGGEDPLTEERARAEDADGDHDGAAQDPKVSLFGADALGSPESADAALIAAYEAAGRTLDDLPYTAEFERIYEAAGAGQNRTRREVFRRLHNLRKAGKLPRLGRAATAPIRLRPAEERVLVDLVVAEVGTLGQRDRLAYGDGFGRVAAAFASQTGRSLSEHDLWRVICKVAK